MDWLKKTTEESLVFVEGGTFMEGDVGYYDEDSVHHDFGSADARPLIEVTIESYSMQKYEVSFKEFDMFLTATDREPVVTEFDGTVFKQPQLPAKYITWQEAHDYCEWVGEQLDLPMELPTETQWEYAARSRGLAVEFATNDGTLRSNENVEGTKAPRCGYPSGHFPPNPLGIYDMSGSRYEWTDIKVVRGVAGYDVYTRTFHEPTNTSGKGIRCVVNKTTPVLIEKP